MLELTVVRGEEEDASDAARYARGSYSVRRIAIGLQLDPSRVRGFAERHEASRGSDASCKFIAYLQGRYSPLCEQLSSDKDDDR